MVRQSLETAVSSVAKQRLPDQIREYCSRHEPVKAFAGGKMTVGDAVEVYRGKVSSESVAQAALERTERFAGRNKAMTKGVIDRKAPRT